MINIVDTVSTAAILPASSTATNLRFQRHLALSLRTPILDRIAGTLAAFELLWGPSRTAIATMGNSKNPAAKFYAVRAGHTPGIYLDWETCRGNITGFRGASFKSFLTRKEAEDFVAGRTPQAATTVSSPTGSGRFYGVACGKTPGVYTTWDEANEQITGWKNPKYKKFATREEAESFVKHGGAVVPVALPVKKRSVGSELENEPNSSQPPAKRAKDTKRGSSVDFENLGFEAQDGADVLRVYTDGSSLSNGRVNAVAGVGVFFGEGDSRNVSEALAGDVQTNQRAELTAILRALQIAPLDREVWIYTDSSYSINCVTIWYKNWERRDWRTSQDKPVMNKDLIQDVLARIRERKNKQTKTEFFWVRGHNNDPCNEAADRLAVDGAHRALLERRARTLQT